MSGVTECCEIHTKLPINFRGPHAIIRRQPERWRETVKESGYLGPSGAYIKSNFTSIPASFASRDTSSVISFCLCLWKCILTDLRAAISSRLKALIRVVIKSRRSSSAKLARFYASRDSSFGNGVMADERIDRSFKSKLSGRTTSWS
jgi:hypothetical protein